MGLGDFLGKALDVVGGALAGMPLVKKWMEIDNPTDLHYMIRSDIRDAPESYVNTLKSTLRVMIENYERDNQRGWRNRATMVREILIEEASKRSRK